MSLETDISLRLVHERKRLGLNQGDFGRLGGVSKGSQLAYEKVNASPSSAYLAALAAGGVDVQYILTGVRSSTAVAPDERLLLDRYRTSPRVIQDAVLRMLLGDASAIEKPTLAGMFSNSAGRDANVTIRGDNNFLSSGGSHSIIQHSTVVDKETTKKRRR